MHRQRNFCCFRGKTKKKFPKIDEVGTKTKGHTQHVHTLSTVWCMYIPRTLYSESEFIFAVSRASQDEFRTYKKTKTKKKNNKHIAEAVYVK